MIFKQYVPEFQDILKYLSAKYAFFTVDSPRRSLTNIELFYVYSRIAKFKPQMVFESGVYKGRSSLFLAEATKRLGINLICAEFSNEEEPKIFKNDFSNLNMIYGKGEDIIKTLNTSQSIIMLIDGPKARSESGMALFEETTKFKNLLCLFQHDVHRDLDRENFKKFFKRHYASTMSLKYLTKEMIAAMSFLDKRDTEPSVLGAWIKKELVTTEVFT